MNMIKVVGVNKVLNSMKRQSVNHGNKFAVGLVAAGLHLQHISQRVYCPVQTGNLKNTAFTRKFGSGFLTDVVVGYTAEYAAFVHEDLTKAHGKEFNVKHAGDIQAAQGTKRGTAQGGMFMRGEHQQAKYLEKPARLLRPVLLRIIKTHASLN